MAIIFVNRFFYPDHSATSQLLTDLTRFLAGNGMQIHVVTGRQLYDDPSAQLSAQEDLEGISIRRVWTTRFGRLNLLGRLVDYFTFYLSAALVLWKQVRASDIVVAKTDPPLISVIIALIAQMRGAVHVNWIQDLFPEIGEALRVKGLRPFDTLLRGLRNASLRTARWNIVLGEGMARYLREQGIGSDTIKVIHNWADGQEIAPIDSSQNMLREQWGLRHCFVVGYSGNIGRAHDFSTILEAADLLRHISTIRFLFIGSGAQLDWVKRETAQKRLDNVLFKPYQPRAHLRFSLTVPDVHLITLNPVLEGLIVPSKFYGIAAAGRPILNIGDPDGEIARLIRTAKCGYTVPISSALEAAQVLQQLSSSKVQCRIMGKRARQLFQERFEKTDACRVWQEMLVSNLHSAA
jgi:colanic acid biosynthesis glycosyl transferase WcaI